MTEKGTGNAQPGACVDDLPRCFILDTLGSGGTGTRYPVLIKLETIVDIMIYNQFENKTPIMGVHGSADCMFSSRGCIVTSTVMNKYRQVSLLKQETTGSEQ